MSEKPPKVQELERREAIAMAQGGPKAIAKQHEGGKLTARERIGLLFDPGTFVETDLFMRHRCTDFGMDKVEVPAEAVITGYGKVNGRTVFAFSQDFTARAGSLGEMHSKKICKVMDLAVKTGSPCVGFNDSGGARIQEAVDSLAGYGQIFYRNSCASGTIPQISAIMGPTAGGAVYSPAMTDWIFMTKNSSYMFITGPDVIRSVTGEIIDFEALGGAMTHNTKSGVAHFACENEVECLQYIRKLLSYLPSNNLDDPPAVVSRDRPDRRDAALDGIIPESATTPYDMKDVLRRVVDDGELFEIHEHYAGNIVIGFARLDGMAVGIVANQPAVLAGVLDIESSRKAARFVRCCDAFNVPLVVFEDVPGFLPGTDQEWRGIITNGAKLLYAFCEATVPKITVITRKAYGGAYDVMNSKHIRGDMNFAWPTAEIAVMGPKGAAEIIFRRELELAADREALLTEKEREYREKFAHPYLAASRGYIDAVIEPSETRPRLISALRLLDNKVVGNPRKKHGNIPL